MGADPPPCPVCGREGGFRPLFQAAGHGFESCRECRFERMADPPAEADLHRRYFEDREHGEMAWREHEQNLPRFREICRRIEARLEGPGRLLDLGCSVGTSLVAARELGFQAVGLELSEPVVEFVRREWGLDVRLGRLEEAGFGPESFDAILMHHTLEHLTEPHQVLLRAHRLLRRGGVMYQALPNHDSLKARLFGAHWSYGVHASHVSLFSRRTLGLLLRRCGFRVVETRTLSSSQDPHLLYNIMSRIGRLDLLLRWCGTEGGSLDQEAYARFITDQPIARWVSSKFWPAGITQALSLGEDLHMIGMKEA